MKEKLLLFKKDGINDGINTISIVLYVMIISGIFGFIYEELFYRIDLGYFVKRGTTFGPWIPIYAFGSLLIIILTYRLKNRPYIVFTFSTVITGLLEYITGYVLYHYRSIRLWNYNEEIWNFGNIGGYVCLRSVLFFGVSSLLLVYIIAPIVIKMSKKIKPKLFQYLSYIISMAFILDIILYRLLK